MKKSLLPFTAACILLSCAGAKNSAPQKAAPSPAPAVAKRDTVPASSLKPYKEIITGKAVTQQGLFKVHQVGDKYYFEIPGSLFDKDILIVNRISKGKTDGVASSYGGDWVGESLIRFSKAPNNKLLFKEIAQDVRAADSSENGLYRAVENSNMQPVVAAFPVKALSPDSAGCVIDMTEYINGDNELLAINNLVKPYISFGLGGYQADKSYIQSIRSFPTNVEIKTVKTYVRSKSRGFATLELNSSIVLLPQQVMQPRLQDDRIGYFATGYYNFDASKPVHINWMITRWRLEPKPEDIEKYKRGELVEPRKPIVYYIDPATPKKWVPYLAQGVQDWQKAFEKAGFKNAIYALQAPTNDSTWSMEDARHNVIVYKASTVANASGPHVMDPRSGEIIETHVNWYHNVQHVLHDWYFVQAGPNDSAARKMEYDESLMGSLIRYVCAHEVGHTLGLMHNFGASSTMPVDSLRSKHFVKENGFCPSIMDYARFNYVAQPEDGFDRTELMPRIGVYDEWAIEWGYRWFPAWKTREDEKAFFNAWVIRSLNQDNRRWYGAQTPDLNFDPKRQNQDLGDDAVKASRYGIKNLKRVVPNLKTWSKVPNQGYNTLSNMYHQVYYQFRWYLMHVITNIGGMEWSDKTVEQQGATLHFTGRVKQQEAVRFLEEEIFTRPAWMIDPEIYRLMAGSITTIANDGLILFNYELSRGVLQRVLNYTVYHNLLLAQSLQPENAYPVAELLSDMEHAIWKELKTWAPIDTYRRDVQKLHVDRLISQLDPTMAKENPLDKNYVDFAVNSDVYAIIDAHLRGLQKKIAAALPYYKDKTTRMHLEILLERIRKAYAEREK